jgi:hypothetical protein
VADPLLAAFRSNDEKTKRILVSPSDDGVNWGGGVDTSQRSRNTASQVFFQGKFWGVFIADDDTTELVLCSSTDGLKWSSPKRLGQLSIAAPSLAVFDNQLWIAYVAPKTEGIRLISSKDWSKDIRIGQVSSSAPSLAAFDGKLWIAFVDTNFGDRIFVLSSSNGMDWPDEGIAVGPSSHTAPSLAAFNTKLWVAFRDFDGGLLVTSSPNGEQWSKSTPIGQSSKAAPFLAVFNSKLWIAFVANNDTNSILVCSSPDGASWSNNSSISQFSPFPVSLFSKLLYSFNVRPKYQLVTVVYAPPGAAGGKSGSQVDYAKGSSLASTISTTDSFKSSVGVKATVGAGAFSLGSEFGYSTTGTDSSSVEVKKSENWDIRVTGPSQDGINHDLDIFYLWLNPLLKVTIDSLNNLTWELDVDGPTMILQYVYAGWLHNPATMPPGLQQVLDKAGLTAEDYQQILSTNPFLSGPVPLDPNRFLPTTQSFPYVPPYSPNDTVPTLTFTQQNTVVRTASHTTDTKYSVGFEVSAGFSGLFSASLKVSTSLEWTNISSKSSSNTATQLATVIVGGPAFTYTGPTDVLVYWDSVFNSFAFTFADQPAAHSGTMMDASGQPVAYEPVTLNSGGHQLSTFTDSRGGFRFYGAAEGEAELAVRGKKVKLQVGAGQPASNLTL